MLVALNVLTGLQSNLMLFMQKSGCCVICHVKNMVAEFGLERVPLIQISVVVDRQY
jgi:hypothetical protein